MIKKPYEISISTLPKGLVEVTGSISWEALSASENLIVAELGKEIKIDGFRPGAAPEAIVRNHLSDKRLLEHMAERALSIHYPNILLEEKIDAIGEPTISITKLARNNPLEFRITTAVVPTLKLPDYRAIALGIPKEEISDVAEEEVAKVVEELQHSRFHQENPDHQGHNHAEENFPPADDAFAQSFGSFKTIQELKDKITENLRLEKTRVARDKRRMKILEAIAKEIEIEIPEVLVATEKAKFLAQLEHDLSTQGVKLESYLTHAGKTKEQLLAEFHPEAEKRATLQLIVEAIAKDASLEPDQESIDKETKALSAHYPGADPARARAYVRAVLQNDRVLSFLESL